MSEREPVLIGLDVGTTNFKAVAFDLAGRAVAHSSTPTQTHYPQPGWAYYDPDEVWEGIAGIISDVTTALGETHQIAGIAACSMGEAAVPIDDRGDWLYPAIAWFDNRTIEQAEWWRQHVGSDEVFQTTGLPIQHILGLNKIMWLRQHEPDAYNRMASWLNMADYVAFKLSGAKATDYSLASRTMALDLGRREWSTELIETAGVRADIFPRLVPSGEQIGSVSTKAAQATGLPPGTPVVSGGHDHICGALAAGVTQPGDLLDSIGTAEALILSLDKPILKPELGQAGYTEGVHVVPDQYYILSAVYTSGASVDWIRDILLPDKDHAYRELLSLAADAPVGSLGVFFVPHLRMADAPHDDPLARGAFIGLSTDSGCEAMARAVLEGLAYAARQCIDPMTQMVETSIRRYKLIGGGTRNRLLLDIKATVLNQSLTLVGVEEATTLGAAILAGLGTGLYRDVDDALSHMVYEQTSIEPDSESAGQYEARYQKVYTRIYDALRDLNHVISEEFASS